MIDPRAAIGEVHLAISDLDRSLRFYQAHLGFTVHQRGDETDRLGAGGPDPPARPARAIGPTPT